MAATFCGVLAGILIALSPWFLSLLLKCCLLYIELALSLTEMIEISCNQDVIQ